MVLRACTQRGKVRLCITGNPSQNECRNQERRNVVHGKRRPSQAGATLAEFAIIAPLILIIGMSVVQAGLVFHGKTTLNYATFEAARAGATRNAQLQAMRQELGYRLAPLQGGDGSRDSALVAMGRSALAVKDESNTRIKIINPTTAAFDDWGIDSHDSHVRLIPNSHLRHRGTSIGSTSGLSLRDANLLKIEVTHGLEMKVPFVNKLITRAMLVVDPDNAFFYSRNRLPLKAVATVRMQSEAWEDQIVLAGVLSDAVPVDSEHTAPTGHAQSNESPTVETVSQEQSVAGCSESGLENNAVLMTASSYEQGNAECLAGDSGAYAGSGALTPETCD